MLRSLGAKVYVCPAHVSADDERSYYNVAKRLHEETKVLFTLISISTN
jgi:cystathionine beta-synthase